MSETQGTYATKAQTIFRIEKNKDNPYVMIDRRLIENSKLSWKAKGLLAYLLSRPDNWTVRFKDLVKRSPDGGHTVRAAMKELRKAGHVKVIAERENGRIKQWVYTVYELPDVDFQQVEKQDVENRTFNNNESFNDTDFNNGVDTPNLSDMPIEWQIAGNAKGITQHDQEQAKRRDFANLVATGTANRLESFMIALTFQDERNITLPESKVKGQRKAIKEMLEMGVKAIHVREATRQLIDNHMTVTDLFSISKTAIDFANKPEPKEDNRPEYQPFPFLDGGAA